MKERSQKIKRLVLTIGICVLLTGIILPTSIGGGGPSGPWDFWSNKPNIFNTNAGNVGIGTEHPDYKVDIVGNRLRLNESKKSNSKTIELRTDGAAVDVNANNADLFLHSWTGNTILQAFGGKVGIGTTPDYTLDVVGNQIRLRDTSGSTAKQIQLRTDGAAVDVNAYNADLFLHSWTGNTILQAFGGKVGIGTGIPEAELHIKDALGHADLMLESNGGTKWNFGAANDRLFFATYDMGWQNYMIIEKDSGRVGIGTVPEYKLDVVGDEIRLRDTTDPAAKQALIRTDGAAVDVCANNADLFLHSYTGNTLIQAFGGKVGIGRNPDYTLDVVGNEIRLSDSAAPTAKQMLLRTDGSAVDVNANNADLYLHSWTGNTILQAFGGRVGIGTQTPETDLHIRDPSGHADLMLESSGGTKWNLGASHDRFFLATYDMGWQNYMIIEKDSGRVGIGTVPEYKLDVVGDEIRLRDTTDPAAKQALIRTDGAAVDVCANNADLFLHSYTGNTLIQPFGGNVGIGTTNPARTLHINNVMRLEPIATFPSNAGDGDLCVVGTTGNYHIYCYLNGDWKQLD